MSDRQMQDIINRMQNLNGPIPAIVIDDDDDVPMPNRPVVRELHGKYNAAALLDIYRKINIRQACYTYCCTAQNNGTLEIMVLNVLETLLDNHIKKLAHPLSKGWEQRLKDGVIKPEKKVCKEENLSMFSEFIHKLAKDKGEDAIHVLLKEVLKTYQHVDDESNQLSDDDSVADGSSKRRRRK
jgi:hypothetical protein